MQMRREREQRKREREKERKREREKERKGKGKREKERDTSFRRRVWQRSGNWENLSLCADFLAMYASMYLSISTLSYERETERGVSPGWKVPEATLRLADGSAPRERKRQ